MRRVLCIASHPDDEVLGVGGTLLRHTAAGHIVKVVLTHFCRHGSESESREAERVMGIGYERLWETGRDVEDVVAEHAPEVVYVHSPADLHHDHQEASYRALVACRPQSGVRDLYAFETPSATDWSGRPFTPQQYVDITTTLDRKLKAWSRYMSEQREAPHPRNEEALRMRAAAWGQRAGVMHAEAFEVVRSCW